MNKIIEEIKTFYLNEDNIKLYNISNNIINVINSNNIELINVNLNYLICYNIKRLDIFKSNINNILINEDCKISLNEFKGNIIKYKINKNNIIKKENTFSFIF